NKERITNRKTWKYSSDNYNTEFAFYKKGGTELKHRYTYIYNDGILLGYTMFDNKNQVELRTYNMIAKY
ncbi:MAG: hypothetical protein ACR2KB_06160, partial [Chitinophagaceae bacterium]